MPVAPPNSVASADCVAEAPGGWLTVQVAMPGADSRPWRSRQRHSLSFDGLGRLTLRDLGVRPGEGQGCDGGDDEQAERQADVAAPGTQSAVGRGLAQAVGEGG